MGYEILLMRLFSIIQWHHFAYLIISLALLGYGVSGILLALNRERLVEHFFPVFPACVTLFALAAPGCFWLAQRLPFNPAEIFWAPAQLLYLFLLYVLLALPFFFAATAVALALCRFRRQAASVYAFDLMGAGLGSLIVISLLFFLLPEQALVSLAFLGLAALLPVCLAAGQRGYLATGMAAAVLLVLVPQGWKSPQVSPYKELRQLLRVPGTRIIDAFSSPLGYVHVVKSTVTPLRHATGLSLNADASPPEQLAVFTDADNMTALTRYDGNPQTIAYLGENTAALPFHLRRPQRLLILGAGTGADLLQAHLFGVRQIDAVELNGQLLHRLIEKYDDFSGGIFSDGRTALHVGEARGFVTSANRRYDMIELALLDAFGASSAGLYALSENYLYTVEALQDYLRHLEPEGYLAITRWVKMPPRDTLKLFATAVQAMTGMGIRDPAQRLLLIRGWQTATLLVKNGEVTPQEIQLLRQFCESRSFDMDYYPGISEGETNRFNILQESYFHRGATALLGPQSDDFMERYKFDIRPATDDQPYFFQFFKWTTLPEILSVYGRGGISLLESGYLILVAGLVQALAASALFIALPLLLWRSKLGMNVRSPKILAMQGYFFCLGLAFLFLEIAFIQKFILILHHPLYATTVVLSTFLVSAGAGSEASRRLARWRHGPACSFAAIILLAMAYLRLLDSLAPALLHQPAWTRVMLSALLTAVLGFFMGMPFPLGLARADELSPALIPWAWGLNGFASVISAILATLIAVHFGFDVLVASAAGIYGLAALLLASTTWDRAAARDLR